jgi:anaerobic magnesium-protoporphyrin IX monomethyl ester cyclase
LTTTLLIYPFFRRAFDRSRFRFPPLGIAYVAATLCEAGHEVSLLDCTFLTRDQAVRAARVTSAEVVGIYSMATMLEDALGFADALRGQCDLLVAGGPLPTCDPGAFVDAFDVVVRGEGEQTMIELLATQAAGADLGAVPGVVLGRVAGEGRPGAGGGGRPNGVGGGADVADARPRRFAADLDTLPFPARDLLPNDEYIRFGQRAYGHSITTVMSTRGCPYRCEFCSNVVFGASYRERSPENVLDEVEQALRLGYERISFADDVFTLDTRRVRAICEEIGRRGLRFGWECLGRVDTFDDETARAMKEAGCFRVFFGIESGNDDILALMNKKTTTAEARAAVECAHRAGLEVGAFFIVCYPGETDETVLDTLRFATSLPLDYVGLTMPYPLPGTALLERIGDRVTHDWRPQEALVVNHTLTYEGDFSAAKMRFALLKGRIQTEMRRRLGPLGPPALELFEKPTDMLFRLLK